MSEPVIAFKMDDWYVVIRFTDLETVKPEDFLSQVPAYRVCYSENGICEFEMDKWFFGNLVNYSRINNPDITAEEVAQNFFEAFWEMEDEDVEEVMKELEEEEKSN